MAKGIPLKLLPIDG